MTLGISFRWIRIGTTLTSLLGPLVGLSSVALLIALPTASFAQAIKPESDAPFYVSEPCSYDLPYEVVENGEAHCGYLAVSVRHANPQGLLLRLKVLTLDARNRTEPGSPPLIVLHGGPGGSALGSAYTFANSPLRDHSDLILFDQRGSGYSGPQLACPEVVDAWFDESGDELSEQEQYEAYLAGHRECSERLSSEGFDVGAYTTHESAADVEDLRIAMGFDKVGLYGVSYGAELALAVMSAFPDGLQSVILDSPVPPYGGTYLTERAAVDALIAVCGRDWECRKAYPSLAEDFELAVSALNDQPVTISFSKPRSGNPGSWKMDGSSLVSVLGESLRVGYTVPIVPLIIHDASLGSFPVIELATEMLAAFVDGVSWGTNYAVNCGSQGASFTSTYLDPLNADFGDMYTSVPEECVFWSTTSEILETSLEPGLKPPSDPIPTLIMAGQFDPLTTPNYSLWLADQLPDAATLTIANAGHGVLASSNCADILMRDFLASPMQAPFPDCLRALGNIDFVTDDELVRMPFVEFGLGIARRSSWTIGALIVFGTAGLIVLVSSMIAAIERRSPKSIRKWWRARRPIRRWEALHPPPPSRLTDRRLIIALAIFSIVSPWPLLFLPDVLALTLMWLSPLFVIALVGIKQAKKTARRKQLLRSWKKMVALPAAGKGKITSPNTGRFALMLIATVVSVVAVIFWGLILEDYSAIFGLPKSAWFLWVVVAVTVAMGLLTVRDGIVASRRSFCSTFRRVFQLITSAAAAVVVITLATLVVRGVL